MLTDNKTLLRNTIEEIYNKGNLNLADELVSGNYVAHDSTTVNPGTGSNGLKNQVTTLRTAFPDLRLNIEELLQDADTVSARLTAQGTHKGNFLNIPATGRNIKTTGILISHVKNGKLTDSYINWDAVTVLQQIGAIPAPGQAS